MFWNNWGKKNLHVNHFTEKEVVLYVDKILSSNVKEFPKDKVLHIEKCIDCKKKVLDYKSTFADMDLDEVTLNRLEKKQKEAAPPNMPIDEEEMILNVIPEDSLIHHQTETEELEK